MGGLDTDGSAKIPSGESGGVPRIPKTNDTESTESKPGYWFVKIRSICLPQSSEDHHLNIHNTKIGIKMPIRLNQAPRPLRPFLPFSMKRPETARNANAKA